MTSWALQLLLSTRITAIYSSNTRKERKGGQHAFCLLRPFVLEAAAEALQKLIDSLKSWFVASVSKRLRTNLKWTNRNN